MSRADLLAKRKVQATTIDGVDLYLRVLTLGEVKPVQDLLVKSRELPDNERIDTFEQIQGLIIDLSVCTESGERMLKDGDHKDLEAVFATEIFTQAWRLNGFNKGEEEPKKD